ncbi:helix-turn-helix transcriptional regulator [Telmatospirillum sp. J64-1]|uniref:helix-turn-helix transcriptional regulator n=1 Tax=Telmatospirillum sp. J64-1 TaxID=2502183 RepID=UPI001C8F264F|nr:helix-turn-helix transcriptional regulator [Telmatospirillum sp. J64-1]
MSDESAVPELMGTKEVAAYLRIKERKVYELVSERKIPCTRATGKWLFVRSVIDRWLMSNTEFAGDLGGLVGQPPPVVAGSNDPLLDWALREAGCGLALLSGGSADGLEKMASGEALMAGVHLFDPETGEWNLPQIRERLGRADVVAIEWARRRQGLVLAAGNPLGIAKLSDLAASGARIAVRQSEAGSQRLFEALLEKEGLSLSELTINPHPVRSETDLGLAVLEGSADAGPAIEAVAGSLKLDFLPLVEERYDLVLRRRDYFEPPFQKLLAFAKSAAFAEKARALAGYDVTGLGNVRYNGP